ncbi:hypothetical protein [Xanthomonas campestris]|uniref:hypothetical protein n=1 Tax=Xanthomonas campestris TaxID=339 RepID=UPI001EDF0D2D|nr:hypothetical protein [Xanthomonas campestris]
MAMLKPHVVAFSLALSFEGNARRAFVLRAQPNVSLAQPQISSVLLGCGEALLGGFPR